MENFRPLIQKVLEKGYLISLASVDEHGPWVSDVIYTFDDTFNVYWISRAESRHSKAFALNTQAAGSITVVDKPEGKGEGIQLAGTAMEVSEIPPVAHVRYTLKRNRKEGWTLLPGEVWYKLAPKLIDLIYEPLFGFTKKTLILDGRL